MKAIRQHAFGGPGELRVEDVPDPQPGEGQVRIRVQAAGVHLLDTLIRNGQAGPRAMPALPMTPGREVAGVVDQAGPGTDSTLVGRRVVADLGLASGGYAEFAVADAGALHDIPASLDAEQAVAMIGTGRTAMAILELAQPARGDVVVITAAAGGIGTLLVQASRNAGATVIAAAGGAAKTALVRQLGAAITADYLQPDWAQHARAELHDRGATLVLDGVGGDLGHAAMNLLVAGGRLVMYGQASGSLIPLTAGDLYRLGITAAAAIGARILQRPGGLRDLETKAIHAGAQGHLKPVIGQRYPLADAAAAHTAIETRSTTGKTILRP
jgi:NADPH:quinone reductase